MVMITLRTDLTRIQRTNLETCITVHMHQKESTEDLVRKKVSRHETAGLCTCCQACSSTATCRKRACKRKHAVHGNAGRIATMFCPVNQLG